MRCLGTSLRLKTRWGSGYHLTMALEGPRPEPSPVTKDTDNVTEAAAESDECTPGSSRYEDREAGNEISAEEALISGIPLDQHLQVSRGEGAAADRLKAAVAQCLGEGTSLTCTADICGGGSGGGVGRLSLVVPQEDSEQLLRLLDIIYDDSGQLGVMDLQISLSTLEDVYMSVVKQI